MKSYFKSFTTDVAELTNQELKQAELMGKIFNPLVIIFILALILIGTITILILK